MGRAYGTYRWYRVQFCLVYHYGCCVQRIGAGFNSGGTYNQLHVIPSNQVVVVTLPSTDIYPTVDIPPSKSKDVMYTVMLNAGEVYHAQSNTDVTGTRIVARSANGIACKKVAAFSGSSFTRVGCANG